MDFDHDFDGANANDNVTQPPPNADDRRRSPRQRVLLSGKLAFGKSNLTADCTVKNLSEGGALVVTADMPLPRDPFLIVTTRGLVHKARTAWREGARSGLAFDATWRFDEAAPKAVTTLRNLWLDLLPH